MIEIKDVTKRFDKIKAVDHVSFSIREENVFGLIGTNGAGKSTMLRMLAGVLKPDGGMVLVDGMQVYDNVNAKKCFFFIGDEPYFFSTATPRDMEKYYSSVFPPSAGNLIICTLPTSAWTAGGKSIPFPKA